MSVDKSLVFLMNIDLIYIILLVQLIIKVFHSLMFLYQENISLKSEIINILQQLKRKVSMHVLGL